MATVELADLSVGYGERTVLEGVAFTAEQGILVILGPNGCGKSTLLNCISGYIKPRAGSILINGKPVASMKRRAIAREVTLVTQEHYPAFGYTVEDMVLMGRTPYFPSFGLPSRRDRMLADEAMARVGVSELRKRPYTELSGGERKLVLIAMALCQTTNVVLLDEPTSFLDVKNSFSILQLVRSLVREEGKTLIIAMHDVNQAISCGDEAFLIFDSTRFVKGRIEDIVTEENLAALYDMKFEIGSTESKKTYAMPMELTS